MTSDTAGIVHQGEIAAEYRRRRKWSRAKLAGALGVDESTVYRMENMPVIRNLTRRQLLVGILGIPAELMGLEGKQRQPLKTNLVLNDDRMGFFENVMATRWDVYHTGGTILAYRGLNVWMKEAENFAHETIESFWHARAYSLLSMSYQLQGSIFRDMMQYEQAHASYKEAFRIAKELNDPELMAATLARRGITFIQQSRPMEAIEYLNGGLKYVNGLGLPSLRGYILQALSEAYAIAQEGGPCWRNIELAERALERRGEVLERSNCQPNTSSVMAQKGVDAVLLHDNERAVALIDKSLLTYNHTYVRGRARLMAQKAEAYYGLGFIDMCCITAEEALTLARSAGSSKTIGRVRNLFASLQASRWRNETSVARLRALLVIE